MLAETTPTMFLADPQELDVYCHHDIHWQAFASVAELLEPHHKCNRMVGPAQKPLQNNVAVLIDHACFQPFATKENYNRLIHFPHDVADLDIYKNEKENLKTFDLILTCGNLSKIAAKKTISNVPVIDVGWPKMKEKRNFSKGKNKRKKILYAPTSIENGEWKEILPWLAAGPFTITVKNHIYYNFESGQNPPQGNEIQYIEAIKQMKEMQRYLKEKKLQNVKEVSRKKNLCELFENHDILITDNSSAAAEFINFGPCIETGRFGKNKKDAAPYIAKYTTQVKFIPSPRLCFILKNRTFKRLFELHKRGENPFISKSGKTSAKYAAQVIDALLFVWQQKKGLKKQDKPISYFKKFVSSIWPGQFN